MCSSWSSAISSTGPLPLPLPRRLASGEGIVVLGVCLCVEVGGCVSVSAHPRLQAAMPHCLDGEGNALYLSRLPLSAAVHVAEGRRTETRTQQTIGPIHLRLFTAV